MEFLIGIFVGGLLYWLIFCHKKPSGTFVMDFSDPTKDVCRIELDEDINVIYSKKHILLKIKMINVSQ